MEHKKDCQKYLAMYQGWSGTVSPQCTCQMQIYTPTTKQVFEDPKPEKECHQCIEFITKIVKETRQQVISEIEGKLPKERKEYTKPSTSTLQAHRDGKVVGANEILMQVKELLNEMKKG